MAAKSSASVGAKQADDALAPAVLHTVSLIEAQAGCLQPLVCNELMTIPWLQFEGGLLPCTLLRRYKRFLADVVFGQPATHPAIGGQEAATVVHCANTGWCHGQWWHE